ncbi:hypothetical protein GXM_02291 [Nostoc sphaeroides CCNUC1]|uniref:Uncharacterized protein n=1 Tax=Nostoc sphaeroides CCNUC1 TaxID=2653204 RepID=A0A5P8VXF2_9NOSO|nr:hypothetical protein GXM_02291 [Nostoc sphaeroides CCNUC1]
MKLVRNRVAAKAARLLFKELVKLCPVDAIANPPDDKLLE